MKTINYALMSSLCALIIGVLLVVWPDVAVNYLVITIGVLFLLPGLLGLFAYFALGKQGEGMSRPFPIVALGSACFGLWLVIMPSFFVNILMYVLGVLLVLGGIGQLANFMSVRRVVNVPVIWYLIPSLILLVGLVVLFNPFEVATIPFILLGISAIVYGGTDLIRLLFYRNKKNGNITDVTIMEE